MEIKPLLELRLLRRLLQLPETLKLGILLDGLQLAQPLRLNRRLETIRTHEMCMEDMIISFKAQDKRLVIGLARMKIDQAKVKIMIGLEFM